MVLIRGPHARPFAKFPTPVNGSARGSMYHPVSSAQLMARPNQIDPAVGCSSPTYESRTKSALGSASAPVPDEKALSSLKTAFSPSPKSSWPVIPHQLKPKSLLEEANLLSVRPSD